MNNTEVFAAVADAGSFAMRGHKQRCMSAVEPAIPTEGDLKDEEQDRFLGVPLRRYCPTRSSAHILDSFRRHSWEPGKRMQEEESNYDELSLSLKGLDPEEIDEAMGYPRDPRRTPITCSNDELENLLLMRGEDLEVTQEEQAKRLRAYLSSQNYLYNSLSKSVSMTGIDHCYPDDVSLYSHGQRMTNGLSAVSCGEFGTLETDEKENRIKEESPFGRTLSFIKKMTSGKHKNKEKEKMKEREKDAKDTRYTNGHLFTTISVSGTTMCFVCNKSITAKEALICPTHFFSPMSPITHHYHCAHYFPPLLHSGSPRWLLERRKDSLASDSNKNFVINKLGDILINQFSGTNAEHMKKSYTEFCSQHQKAVKLYKELFSRDKKFQQLIRKMTRSQLLRRHGVPECILLVTQRITKYPVLIDRILQNSKVEALKDVIITIGNEQPITGHQNHTSTSSSNPTYGDSGSVNGSLDKDEDPSQRDRNGNQLQNKSPQEEALQRISNLYNLLHGLQVVVCQQDSLLSLQMPDGTDKKDNLNRSDKKESLSRTNSRDLSVAEPPSKNIDKSGTELTLLQRQHTLLQEELRRCRRQCEERAQESGTLETRLRESEQMRSRLERELEEGKRQLAVLQKGNGLGDMGRSPRGTDPRRRSLPAGDALYQTFTPPQIGHERRSIAAVDGSVPTLTLQEDSDQKDEFSDLTELERLPETAETESSEEEGGGPPISPSSTREFQRMQDIPEEAESVQDLRDAETGSSES
uniref:DH domain-containing protein n=1 Tax=Pyxicephalus adspersus TaxID=30357 RepID=A0AAV2ZN31_PYXAD|nr:TPA: hypothetical protein GDO54_004934 [Pyxicephalus adspersus]